MSYPVKDSDPTIGRLVTDASRDISTLISQEIQLAKSELQVSIKNGGTGLGLFAAAGFFGVMSLIMLSIAIAVPTLFNLASHSGVGVATGLGVAGGVIIPLWALPDARRWFGDIGAPAGPAPGLPESG